MKIQFPDTVFCQEIDGEIVLLDMSGENYFGLDAIGSDIWNLLREGKSIQETFNELQEIYDVSPEQLKSDLDTFLAQLSSSGLISFSE
jgi:hypothetical protein